MGRKTYQEVVASLQLQLDVAAPGREVNFHKCSRNEYSDTVKQFLVSFNVPGCDSRDLEVRVSHDRVRIVPRGHNFGVSQIELAIDSEFVALESWTVSKGVFYLVFKYELPLKYAEEVKAPVTSFVLDQEYGLAKRGIAV